MATELGVAYLSLSASTKDFAKDVKAALKDVEHPAEETGKRTGSALGKGVKTGLKVVGGAVAGVAAIVGGIALKGGIDRALAIEDAQAKLKGLGHDTKSVQTIMDSALASVKGTAFGLGDAATVAASVVAAGVQPGEDLTRTLKLVADASTIAGTSMSDMGLIFNKVASTGKIQGEVIAQLGERGIPILQLLGEQLGVSAAEVSKLASEGKVDFETFQAAMEAGMGGAALESGNTFRGAMANTMAALGRLGESVVGGVLPQIKGGFGDAIAVLDSWAPQAEAVGKAIGEGLSTAVTWIRGTLIPAIQSAAEAFQSVVSWIQQNSTWLSPLAAAVAGAAAAWALWTAAVSTWAAITRAAAAVQAAFNLVMAANPIMLVVMAIAALVAGLVYFFTQTELGQQIWAGFTEFLGAAWETIKEAFAAGWEAISTFLGRAWEFIKTVWSYSPIGMIVSNWDAIMAFFRGIPDKVKAFFDRAVEFIKRIWSYTPIGLITTNFGEIVDFFKGIPDRIKNALGDVGNLLKDAGRKIIQGLADGITGAISKATDAIKNVTARVREYLPFSPAKKGPFSGRGYSLYSGQALAGDFAKGMLSQRDKLGNAADQLMGAAALVPLRSPVPMEATFGMGAAGGGKVESHLHVSGLDAAAVIALEDQRLRTVLVG